MLLKVTLALAALSVSIQSVSAHTWLDCVKLSDPNNRVSQCVGYPRGWAGRPPVFDIDNHFTNRVFNWDPNAASCAAVQTNNQFQRLEYPRARVQAGETVSALYFSNGHVNKDNPLTNSTHAFYWTGVQNQQITRMGELTPLNRLSPLQNFDDCVCGEYGEGDRSLWNPKRSVAGKNTGCQAFFTVPPNTPSGVYQVVWYWQYNKYFNAPTPMNKEEYSSCFDIVVQGPDCTVPQDLPYTYTSTQFSDNSFTGPTYPKTQTDVTNGFVTLDQPERPVTKVSQSTFGKGFVGTKARAYGLVNGVSYPNQLDVCADKSGGTVAPSSYGTVPIPPAPCTAVVGQTAVAGSTGVQQVSTVVATAPVQFNPTGSAPTTTPLASSTGPNFPQQTGTAEVIGSTAYIKPTNTTIPPKSNCALKQPTVVARPPFPPASVALPTPVALPDCAQDAGPFVGATPPAVSAPPCFLTTLQGDAVAATSLPGGVSATAVSFDVLVQYSAQDFRSVVVTLCKSDLTGCVATGSKAVAPGSGVISVPVFYYLAAPLSNQYVLSIYITPQASVLSSPRPQSERFDWKLYPFTVAAVGSPSGCPGIPTPTAVLDRAAARNFPVVAPTNATLTLNVQYAAPQARIIQAGLCRIDAPTQCAALAQVNATASSGSVVDIPIQVASCDAGRRYIWVVRSIDAASTASTLTYSTYNGTCGGNDESARTSTCAALSQFNCVSDVEIATKLLQEKALPVSSSSSTSAPVAPSSSTASPPPAAVSSTGSAAPTAVAPPPAVVSSTSSGVVVLPPSQTTDTTISNPLILLLQSIKQSPVNPNIIITPFGNFTFGNGFTTTSLTSKCVNNATYTCSSATASQAAGGVTMFALIASFIAMMW